MFAVRVSSGGPTAAPDTPPASDNAPATPNNVTVFVRPFRFEFRLPCDMAEASHFTPALICNYTTTTAATQQRSNRCGWANLLALGKDKGQGQGHGCANSMPKLKRSVA